MSITRHMSRACTLMGPLPHWPSREDGVVAERQVSSESTYCQAVKDSAPVPTVPAMLCVTCPEALWALKELPFQTDWEE